MLYGNDYVTFRQFFHDAWAKVKNNQPLEPMESLAATIIHNHPEFHNFFATMDSLNDIITPESGKINPYLHIAQHLTIIEQINSNTPAGIQAIYQILIKKGKNEHEAQHLMMSVLAEWLEDIKNGRKDLNEQDYMNTLRQLSKSII